MFFRETFYKLSLTEAALQKSSKDVLMCSENMQQIYIRTLRRQSVELYNFIEIRPRYGCFIFSEHLFIRTTIEGYFCHQSICDRVYF